MEPLATSTCREGMKLRATTRSVLRGLVCLVDTAEQQVVCRVMCEVPYFDSSMERLIYLSPPAYDAI